MNARTDANLRAGTVRYLDPDERVVATLIASARGHQQAMVGGVGGLIGGSRQAEARRAAENAGVRLASPMGLVLTNRRLLTVSTGGRGVPKEFLNDIPLAAVESILVKRLGLGGSVTVWINGQPVKLESRVGDARAFAAALQLVQGAS